MSHSAFALIKVRLTDGDTYEGPDEAALHQVASSLVNQLNEQAMTDVASLVLVGFEPIAKDTGFDVGPHVCTYPVTGEDLKVGHCSACDAPPPAITMATAMGVLA